MKKIFNLISVYIILIITNPIYAEDKKDWLLDNSSFKAEVYKKGQDVVMTNGLIERVFRDGTTIRLNNLMTGDGMLRSIRPEAEIVINNVPVSIGGMTGQKVHNYFLPEWLNHMKNDSMAFQCVNYKISDIKTRFDWKPRKEWMTYNPEWPAKGKEVIFSYKADQALINRIQARYSSDEMREQLLAADFTASMPAGWTVKTSPSNGANTFENEGKAGEILIPANSSSFAEKDIPASAEVITAKINPGTDKSSAWGPGLAWVFDKRTVKVYIQTAEGKFGVTGAGMEYEMSYKGFKPGKEVLLKMQRTSNELICSYSYDEINWEMMCRIALPSSLISKSVKVGKMDIKGNNSEQKNNLGELSRCRIDMVKVTGGLSKQQANNQFAYLKDLTVDVHYEIYDGIPLISKWITLESKTGQPVTLNTYKSEILAVMEEENTAVLNRSFQTPNITIESDFTHVKKHNYVDVYDNSQFNRHFGWKMDPLYKTQINWLLQTPCLLESSPQYGPEIQISSTQPFSSHRVWELFHDTYDKERKSLEIRRMYRIAAPWTAENPIFMHVRKADNESVKKAVDQCAEVGFEMIIMTFGSGVNMEDASPANLKRMKELADYAHSKGIALGGYSLLASRSIDKENDVVMPEGESPTFGHSPCVGSEWGQKYMHNLETYLNETGQDILEHDGSYPGDECASTSHPGHKGLADSQWNQFQTIRDFYRRCKANGVFLNIPDWYFMNGQNKTGMGYRETNWSLPRKQQEVIERQNIFDGTWTKTASMGWMMVPLVEYHGGGAAATIEPLKDHLPHYELRLANNFGAGVIACYRGPQLYDSPQTKAVVKKWVDFYKSHRAIIDSDIIHLRRPDGTDWDGFIHVNPNLKEKGLMMLYNPLPQPIKKTINVPLYYTGLKDLVTIKSADGKVSSKKLNRDYSISMQIEIPAYYCNWYTFE